MKLIRIRLEKFRGIRKAEIEVGTELALVGQNSGGKSSVLRALNAFFNFKDERQHFESSRHAFQKTSTAIIDLEFSDAPSVCSLPRIAVGGNNIRVRLKYKRSANWEIFHNGSWQTPPQGFMNTLKTYIRYVYIPVSRNEKAIQWGQESILQETVMTWVKDHVKKRDNISPKVTDAASIIKERTFRSLSKYLRGLTHLNGSFEFELDYSTPPDYSLLIQDLVLRVVDGNTSVDIVDCGSGTQSLAAIGLYSYLAEALGGTYILGIEEPEQNLHPQAQRSLLAALKGLPLQVLFTTHSTVMLDSLEHEEVALCRRVSSSTRGFEITVTQLPSGFWIENSIDRDRYYNFHRRRNSEFFFADYVILTEGPIDGELVRYLIESGGLSFSKYSVSIISLDSVQSLPHAYHLLKELKIDFASVVDKDYFLPYLHDELSVSRDTKGFPRYKREFNNGCLIEKMLPDEHEREKLLDYFFSNHSRAMQVLESVGVFCFRWSMDIDLVGSKTARSILFDRLLVPESERTTIEILVNRRKQLKRQESVLGTTRELQPRGLPNSYKMIRRRLPELVKDSFD
ncbi:AAA family ATPase [Cobetia sp. 10Alg 146]|uniref:ATP-dependent nuclease n=1 Tax=Cobetia sp. 10Alg 146 TaxID=3040019 RepID=UPI0024472169|nr:AAA family ATPase [Cobetia sp. 10Alg 146]MDH2291565.1 AAA family ATPase [Cobetia sp. 10Alg 146]